jgi:two-component system, cell cycle sensor histidine kinase and response regulator CckA
MSDEPSRLEPPKWPVERVLEWIDEGCVLFDRRLDVVYANEPGSALFGLAPAQLVGRNLHSQFPAPIASEFQRAALPVVGAGTSAHATLHDETTGRWLDATMYPSSDGLLALFADVTSDARKELEQAAHTDYLQQLVDQIPAFLWIIDRDLIVRRIEGGRPMLQALDRDRLVGLHMAEVTQMGANPSDLALSVEMHRRALEGLAGQYRATWKGITIEAHIRPLRDRDGAGDVVGIVGVGIDVTEQARMEEQLRGSEERFRAVVEGSTDLVVILGDDLRVTYASPAQAEVLGYGASERKTIDPWSLVHADDLQYARQQFASLESRHSVRMSRPLRIRTKGGEWRSFFITLTDLRRDRAVRGVVVNGRDVTKELALESQLRQSQKLEALGQLAGGVAHDFNNVLAAISGYAELLYNDLARDDPRRHDLGEILKAAERATGITRQLLAFSRHQVPAATRLDLVDVVHQLSHMLRALLPATIDLRVSPERGAAPIEVLADRSQLEQVVMNLVVNARDAMPAGGTLAVDVRMGTTPEAASTAVLEVRDTGIGMSPDVQAHVFEPFFTTKQPGQGTGLGLAMVYGIVRQHSASIEIASAVGEGTTVTVRLPMAPAGAQPISDGAEPVEQDRGGRVLVIEDEGQVREVSERFLRRAGYEVLTAADAGTGLGLLASAGPFDLVLTDSAMPGMRGEDLAAEIAHVQPGLPVILMSGYRDPGRPPAANAVAAFLQKPFTMPGLLAAVRRAIARDRSASD